MLVNSGPGATPARTRRFPRTRPGLLLPALLLLAVASPFLVGAGHALLAGQPTAFLGDQALTELDTRDALAGRQVVGLYSRFGWAHPGPAWLYLLAGPYQLAGATAAALTAAVVLVHLLAALALVVVAARPPTGGRSRPGLVLAVVGVLAFVAAAPPMTFTSVWNPFALLLPTALLVVLAGQGAAGSRPALAWALVVGSALVQTHLGTAPLVAGLTLLATLPTVLRVARRRPRRWWPRRWWARRPPRRVVLVPLLLLAAMWLPPLVEQVRGPQHNLSRLVLFFLTPAEGGHSWREAADVVARALAAYPLLRPLSYQPAESTLGLLAAAFLAAYLSAAAALVLWGRRRRLPAITASGAANLLAPLVAVLAVRRIDGPVYSYLVTWVSALPLALFLGYAAAAAEVASRLRIAPLRRRAFAALAVVGVFALAGRDLVALYQLPTSAYGSRFAGELALAALPQVGPGAVVGMDLTSTTDWQVAAGLAAQLERAGWRVRVPADLAGIFGADRVETGRPPQTLLVGPASRTPAAPARLLGVVPSELGPTAVYLTN